MVSRYLYFDNCIWKSDENGKRIVLFVFTEGLVENIEVKNIVKPIQIRCNMI